MWRYIVIRILLALLTIVVIITLNYSIFYYFSDYTLANLQLFNNNYHATLGSNLNNSQISKNIALDYGIYNNYYSGLLDTIKNLITLNLGNSLFYNQKIITLLYNAIKNSIVIGICSTILIYLTAFILANVYTKYKHQTYILYTLAALYSIPLFALAYLVFYFTYSYIIVLAILIITLNGVIFLTLLLINIFQQQNKLLSVHFFRQNNKNNKRFNIIKIQNISLLLVSDFAGVLVAIIFGSSAVVEIIYNINGIGSLTYSGFKNLDYPLLMSTIYIISLITVVIKIITDIILFTTDKTIKITK